MLNVLARVVGKMDNAILGTNHYPVDSVEFFVNTFQCRALSIQPSNGPSNNLGQSDKGG